MNVFSLLSNKKLGGIVSCSGYVLETFLAKRKIAAQNVETPLLVFHGEADQTVPWSFAKQTYEQTKRLGKQMQFFVDPNQSHEITEAQMKQLVDWFNRILPPSRPSGYSPKR